MPLPRYSGRTPRRRTRARRIFSRFRFHSRSSAAEIGTVRDILVAAGLVVDSTRFVYAGLDEPTKDVLRNANGSGFERRARVLLLGVLPEYRGKGIDSALYHWIWTKSGERGIYWGEAGWILEDNPAMNAGLEKMTFTVYKTYRLYDRLL